MEIWENHFGKRPRIDTTGPFDRPHGRHRSNRSSSSLDSTGDLTMILARLYLQCSCKDWHHNRQYEGVIQPLRQLLFRTLIEEVSKRVHMLKFDPSDDVLGTGLRTRQILTTSNHWNFLGWDPNAKCFKSTKQYPLSSTQLDEMLTRIL